MLKHSIFIVGLVTCLLGCGPEAQSSNSGANSVAVASNNDPSSSDNNAPIVYGVKNPDRIFQTDSLETTTIKTPGGDLKLWIMDNEDKRREGMMFLKDNEVKDNEGMIFVFPEVQKASGNYAFWMHNTLIPLDIDYISKDKKVLNIGKGDAMNDSPVKPAGDYFYVIEVKQGLSAKFGLTPGAKIDISDALKGKP
jgi:uncharacterized membrane protein (UPF0127 family)